MVILCWKIKGFRALRMHPAVFFAVSIALAVSVGGADAASAWPDRFNECFSIEDTDEAERACMDALTSPALSVSERSDVYRRLGTLYRWQERLEDAEASVSQSLALAPDSPRALAELGAVKYLQANVDWSVEALVGYAPGDYSS